MLNEEEVKYIDLLIADFNNSFEYAKFYDDRQHSYLKFALTLVTTVTTAMFLLIQLEDPKLQVFSQITIVFIGLLVSISLFFIFLIMIKNRIYFIIKMRHVNSIRNLLCTKNSDFETLNKSYQSIDIKPFKFFSTQIISIYPVGLLVSIYFGVSVTLFSTFMSHLSYGYLIFIGITIFTCSCLFECLILKVMLNLEKSQSADEIVKNVLKGDKNASKSK